MMRLFSMSLIAGLTCGTAALACPDASLSPGLVRYDAAALGSVQEVAVRAGGDAALEGCALGALGFGRFRAAPDHSFTLDDGAELPVTLAVQSGCDAALLVRTADGGWAFNDDGNGNLDPRLILPAGVAAEGQVDVWVGSFAGADCDATLQIVEAGVRLPIARPGSGMMAQIPLGGVAPIPVQAQAPQPAPLPMPAPMPAPVPAPIPAPIPVAICPNSALAGPSLTLSGPQLLSPQDYVAQVGGMHDVEACPGINGYGMFNEMPSFTLNMSNMTGYQFTAELVSDCDPTMIVNDAYGAWHFNDDGPNGLQPQITLDGSSLNGKVDIWVGGFGGSTCQGTIVFRTAAGMMPQGGAASGCPDPNLQGMAVTRTGRDLYNPQDFAVSAGGRQDVGMCGLPIFATGYFSAQPNLTFYLSGMQEYARLEIQGEAFCDTVLLVRTPDGAWHFDDDSNGGLNPMLDLRTARMMNGRVDVWVGTYDVGGCPATIEMETWQN